jgi:hypothetical protein
MLSQNEYYSDEVANSVYDERLIRKEAKFAHIVMLL